jgi:hypothetical protein
MSVRKGAFLAFVLVGLGWVVGYAQRPQPEFMMAIDAPVGETRVECVSGCELIGARDLGNPNAGRLTMMSTVVAAVTFSAAKQRSVDG